MTKNNWKNIGKNRRAGVLAPLFSIYSKESIGAGDFNDIKLLADWCQRSGLSILQLLPMNEIGSTFCPYDAVSSFALEPMYISLGGFSKTCGKTVKSGIADLRKKFPAGGKRVNYGMREAKRSLLREIYSGDGKGRDSKEFKSFLSENEYWIEDFALFKILKAYHEGRPWYEWADPYRERNFEAISAFRKAHAQEIGFEKWMQWIAFAQFKSAKEHAAANGVLICGDLPILTSRDSADVWGTSGVL